MATTSSLAFTILKDAMNQSSVSSTSQVISEIPLESRQAHEERNIEMDDSESLSHGRRVCKYCD
jgi:hypothetical protein